MKVLIVESPGKVKKIQSFLGPTFKVMASVGHVRDLPERELGIEAPNFKPHYVPTDKGKDVLKKLAAAVKDADTVYLATDPDREGEAIAWHLEDALKLKGAQRVTYTEITESAVKAALAKPRKTDMDLVAAQEGRRVLDRFVGYLVSPALSSQTGQRLSAGRVQSPAVRLIVDREREIKAFRVTVHYGVELVFDAVEHITDGWKALWQPKHGWLEEGQEYILDKTMAEKVAAIRQVKVLTCEESESKQAPPAPFTTSTLQQAASAALKISPKKTMELAQRLYEQGAITYMRTDSPNLSEEAIAEIRSWAGQHDFSLPPKPRTWKSKDGAQEAHEAIRPTHFDMEEAGENEEEKKLYSLIRLRAIASQLEEAVFAVRVLSLEGEVEGKPARFEARGRTMTSPGWKALVATDQTEEGEAEPENPVPKLEQGGQLQTRDSALLTKKTKPPARFSEASLIRELEKRGIGRPSTYAAILDNITGKDYLKIEKRFLVPTATGEKIVDTMTGRFCFLDYDFTKKMEEELDLIAEGKAQYVAVVSSAHGRISKEIGVFIEETSPKCPDCGRPLRHMVREEAKGKSGYNFWSCSGYPDDCQSAFDDDNGVPGPKREKKEAPPPSGFTCPKCGADLLHRQGTSKKTGKPFDFFACSGYPKCSASFDNKDGQPDFEGKQEPEPSGFVCQECGKPLVRRKGISKKTGKPYDFFACTGQPKCKKNYNTKDEQPDFGVAA